MSEFNERNPVKSVDRHGAPTAGVPRIALMGTSRLSRVNSPANDPVNSPEKNAERAPQPIVIATAISVVQSLAVIAFGIFLIVRELMGKENPSMISESSAGGFVGVGTALFIFVVFGFVIAGSWALLKGKRWGRGAIVLVEFILAASSFQMLSGGAVVLGAVVLVSAVAVLGLLLFVPASAQWSARNF
ncbi:hypothetical protein ACTXN7_03445 [Corynebacterium flavescens]|uniref:Transporter n=1 Tax=Corynebacterium flavescens TaxID=28028 RepID=A0AB73B7C2_CORFL|nr:MULTISPECIES: hypothetical protein [Corynebacterium]MDN6099465.1 hypothetical protein [Corynebacterium flavescens]MDN6198952.1 hypothetical protein [Corynebacterium flavescens]MDN6226236.1 hypothetical protein [Corynebacterium flavescens]MDN6237142.1 hypothetical protein [Corynebacterium flavescens]MDN6431470.1 hypothetical protein [Corynebacterium flavescens]